MDSEKYQKAKTIFDKIIDMPNHDRDAFLAEACANDIELADLVKSLLESDAAAGSFIEVPFLKLSAKESSSGKHIGPYKLVRRIGHGGMGAVFLAFRDDEQFKKQVAIKLIKRGMDTDEIIKRFRNERQILASLDHPAIARLLDGGVTDDGLPYLVMEYIEGQPIDDYCDYHKLNTIERLKLFRKVCESVQYAHQNLIIHRDLKPGNILITRDRNVKLLDFGIAKLLNPSLFPVTIPHTQTGFKNMTPEYASPEQVKGEPITTASDVYSLGVLLYELLTGHRPYRLKSHTPREIEDVICSQEPEKPSTAISRTEQISSKSGEAENQITPQTVSQKRNVKFETLRKRLSGDLDNIVLKALRKEPHRRYASVEQLSEDIRRHLVGLPVTARKGTTSYRLAKFVERHKIGAVTTILVSIALLTGLFAASWQAQIAERERARAERRFEDVRKLTNSFLFEFHEAVEKIPGTTAAQELIVQKALEYLNNLSQESEDNIPLRLELAAAYSKIAFIQDNRYYGSLGNTSGALNSYQKALTISQEIAAGDSTVTDAFHKMARSHLGIGDMLVKLRNLPEAMVHYKKGLEIRKRLVKNDAGNVALRKNLAVSYQRVGDTAGNPSFPNLGNREESLENYQQMLSIFRQLFRENPRDMDIYHSLGISYEKFGNMYEAENDYDRAKEYYGKELVIYDSLVTRHPENVRYQRDLGVAYAKVGKMNLWQANYDSALVNYKQTLQIWQQIAESDPENINAKRDLGSIQGVIGNVLLKVNSTDKGITLLRKAVANHKIVYQSDSLSDESSQTYIQALEELVRAEMNAGKLIDSRIHMRTALKLKRVRANRSEASANDLNNYAWALLTCEPSELRDYQTALIYANKAVEMSQMKDPNVLDTQAWAYFRNGETRRAIEIEKKALDMLPENAFGRGSFEEALATFKAAL